jgi:hypothetical protein
VITLVTSVTSCSEAHNQPACASKVSKILFGYFSTLFEWLREGGLSLDRRVILRAVNALGILYQRHDGARGEGFRRIRDDVSQTGDAPRENFRK